MLKTQPHLRGGQDGGSRIGLALAGGGLLGIVYEIGALLALDEALDGVNFNQLHVYVGVSAGAASAASLANGFSPAKLCRIFVNNESHAFPLNPEHFLRPALRLYWEGLKSVPGLLLEALWSVIKHPEERSVLGVLSKLGPALPAGMLDNEPIEQFLRKLYVSRSRTNDFRRLKTHLFIVATNLDTSEIVKFGSRNNNRVPISKAVQASAAIPGLYPPVEVEGRYYIDGGVKKTVHASTALEAGADLLFCINPLVPFNARLAGAGSGQRYHTLVEGGLPVVMAQTLYAMVYSRMKIGLSKYAADYPDRDVLLFEPNSSDSKMFFNNIFSFDNRRTVCEHAYQTTRRDLRERKEELKPLFMRHGITLREDVLADTSRHFDSHLAIPPEVTQLAMLQNPATNTLSDVLDELQLWLQVRRATAAREERMTAPAAVELPSPPPPARPVRHAVAARV